MERVAAGERGGCVPHGLARCGEVVGEVFAVTGAGCDQGCDIAGTGAKRRFLIEPQLVVARVGIEALRSGLSGCTQVQALVGMIVTRLGELVVD